VSLVTSQKAQLVKPENCPEILSTHTQMHIILILKIDHPSKRYI
jgi:hypothetical protein